MCDEDALQARALAQIVDRSHRRGHLAPAAAVAEAAAANCGHRIRWHWAAGSGHMATPTRWVEWGSAEQRTTPEQVLAKLVSSFVVEYGRNRNGYLKSDT